MLGMDLPLLIYPILVISLLETVQEALVYGLNVFYPIREDTERHFVTGRVHSEQDGDMIGIQHT